jgi:hypothetical protein
MPLRDAGIAYKPPDNCDRIKHEEEHKQRNAQADQPIRDETPRPLAVERSGREVSRNQEQDPHKVGLVDECKNEQRGER